MDLERYYELRAILQQWRMRLAESIRRRIEDSARWLARLRAIYEGEGAGEDFATWLDRWCRQSAIQFILRVLFLRVLEDRDLLGVTRIRNTDGQRMWAELTRNLGAAHYVHWCGWDAAHLLPDLFGPTDYDLVPSDDDLVQRFLDDVWRRPDPNQPGWLRFDFRPDPARADEGFQTRFIGDLYQELDAEIRERYALLQTPHFISQFILEHTLLKRFEEKDFREVTLIDPTCGSGHFLVDAFWMFVERYEAAAGGRPPAVSARAEIARTIIETHLFGCDINPYATALARFRLTLAACDYARPTSLRDFRDLRFNLVTIDSLIPYEKLMIGGGQIGSATAKVLGQPGAIQRALPVLRGRYDVVVGNPPYITTQDETKRDLYREHYESAYRSFSLSAPFTERFFKLATDNGYIGLIKSNAFARRQFGKKLIEVVLPQYDLQAVIDLSGAYIPGHGTPTLILIGRNRMPVSDSVWVMSNLKGETSTPLNPAKGDVWRSVVYGFATKNEYANEFIDVTARPRQFLSSHPWQFGGAKSRLGAKLAQIGAINLASLTDTSGRDVHTGLNEVFFSNPETFRRYRIQPSLLLPIVTGQDVRDWQQSIGAYALFPYKLGQKLEPLDIEREAATHDYLNRYYESLAIRRNYGQTILELGLKWYEYSYTSNRPWDDWVGIFYPEIVTHTHFVPTFTRSICDQTNPRLRLSQRGEGEHILLAAILNTNTVCFYLKQICFDKRAGKIPVRDTYYVFAGTMVGKTPIPRDYKADTPNRRRMLTLAEEMINLGGQLPALDIGRLFEQRGEAYYVWNSALDGYVTPHPDLPPPFTTARELRAGRDKLIVQLQDIRGRMIFLQEEMDWLAYEMYGLLRKAPLAEDYLSPSEYLAARLELGQRPFEIAGKGYKGDWPKGYQPAPLPESLRPLTEARIEVIQSNPDIALLEDPLYKRRWVPPDYDKEFRSAAEWWLAEKLEWALEQHGRPISLREWARILGRDERINAVLEALTDSPAFDLEGELLAIIRANAAPDRPEHYLKASGLRKFYAVRNTQHVSQFSRKDFADDTSWKLRGKLNIPRERFITYTQFDHTLRGVEVPETGGPWFGWAGWDAAQRADALAFLLDRANRAGWTVHWQQCGLRASLRDLLPELSELPAAERAEFEAIAGMCGIGLGAACYCQAYRDGVARGEPGVPGVGEEALGVKVLPAEARRAGRGKKQSAGDQAEQLRLDLKD